MKLFYACPMILLPASMALLGCGPSHVHIDPKSVTEVTVRPAGKLLVFCPGKAFKVELIAKLTDGTSCSSTDASVGCMGDKSAIIDPEQVQLAGSSGGLVGKGRYNWQTAADPLETADTGLTLRGWVQSVVNAETVQSVTGESFLKPVYGCLQKAVFEDPPSESPGQDGKPGPTLNVAVTTLATPYYPHAALVRVRRGSELRYYISPSEQEPIVIISKGQDGAMGARGESGASGEAGEDAPSDATCEKGGSGERGGDGGPGGRGGDGGPGGAIDVTLDEAASTELRNRIRVGSPGGRGGAAGPGGNGGDGGRGGRGGPTGPKCKNDDLSGRDGMRGMAGTLGQEGDAGPDGPPAVTATAPRGTLFGVEMKLIQKIESAAVEAGNRE